MRIGILTEFPTVAIQSGPAIHTRFLHDGLKKRDHDVVLIGPDQGVEDKSGNERHLFSAVSYPSHPKVKIPLPWPMQRMTTPPRVDLVHGQANSHMIHYAVWMRKLYGAAVLNTHIIHIPTHSHFLLNDELYRNPIAYQILQQSAQSTELNFAKLYNQGDGFIVQSRHMIDYWRERGVTVPIEAIGRPISPGVFGKTAGDDPFPAHMKVGKRLIVVCRHDREKNLDQLIRIFDREIAPADRDMTLTLVGDGFDHPRLKELAERSRYGDRIHFPGEVKHGRLVDWYAHSDVFVYTSLSETFGNVVNEALWSGLPVVALNDRMGVAHQVLPGVNGALVEPNCSDTDARFAHEVLRLTRNREHWRRTSENAATYSRRTSHPDVILSRYERLYEKSLEHVKNDIKEPLIHASRTARQREFMRHMGAWAAWTAILLGVSNATHRLGFGRKGTDTHYPEQVATPAFEAPAASEDRVVAMRQAAE